MGTEPTSSPLSGPSPHAKWNSWKDQVEEIWADDLRLQQSRRLWRIFNESLRDRRPDRHLGAIANWVTSNYVDSALVCLRRILDRTGTAVSLVLLVRDVARHAKGLPFDDYVRVWGSDPYWRERARRSFAEFADAGGENLSGRKLRALTDRLESDHKAVENFTNSWITHRSADPRERLVTLKQVDRAFDDAHDVFKQVALFVTAGSFLTDSPEVSDDEVAAAFERMLDTSRPGLGSRSGG